MEREGDEEAEGVEKEDLEEEPVEQDKSSPINEGVER